MSLPFTKETDRIFRLVLLSGVLTLLLAVVGLYYYAPPEYTRVGYAPIQPVAYSHEQHVGQLGLSCLYCHKHVEDSPHATIPPAQTCMNCHQTIKATSPLLEPVRVSWTSGNPIRWRRVHKVPDYVYFNHAVHVRRGIGCVNCHGKVNEMPLVVHDQPLSMGWCLDCHRHPETSLRPLGEVTNLDWAPPEGQTQRELGTFLKEKRHIQASDQCSVCHR